jgi:hypothetical protein
VGDGPGEHLRPLCPFASQGRSIRCVRRSTVTGWFSGPPSYQILPGILPECPQVAGAQALLERRWAQLTADTTVEGVQPVIGPKAGANMDTAQFSAEIEQVVLLVVANTVTARPLTHDVEM